MLLLSFPHFIASRSGRKTTFSYVLILTNIFVIFTRETFYCKNGKYNKRRKIHRNIKLLMSWDERKKNYFVFILSSGKCQIVFRFNMDIRVDKFVLMCDFDCPVNLMWQLSLTHTHQTDWWVCKLKCDLSIISLYSKCEFTMVFL